MVISMTFIILFFSICYQIRDAYIEYLDFLEGEEPVSIEPEQQPDKKYLTKHIKTDPEFFSEEWTVINKS